MLHGWIWIHPDPRDYFFHPTDSIRNITIVVNHQSSRILELHNPKYIKYPQKRYHLTKQSIAQAVVDGLNLCVVLQGVRAELTADTRRLVATEGSLVGDEVVVVDPHSTVEC